jgi:hypothetical protein
MAGVDLLVVELGGQGAAAAVQACLHRPGRDPQGGRDLPDRHAEQVVHDQRLALAHRQGAQSLGQGQVGDVDRRDRRRRARALLAARFSATRRTQASGRS